MLGLLALLVLVTTALAFTLGLHNPLTAVIEAVAIAACVLIGRFWGRAIDNMLIGSKGERQVGSILDSLAQEGWRAIHGGLTARGDIDHIAVGPGGLFTIETKFRGGRFDVGHVPKRELSQAYAEAREVERIAGHPAVPLLVLTHAFIEGRGVNMRDGVTVLPARMLRGLLTRRAQPAALGPEQIDAVYELLASALA